MQRGKSTLWLVLILLVTSKVVTSQESLITLERITPDGGLTYSSVMCITGDSLGYMWFGTNNGLFRYDSKQIKRYFHDNSDPASLPVNRINQFLTDRQQKLWIATENGLCLYDRDYDSFKKYHFTDASGNPTGSDTRSVVETPDGEIWIADERGIAILDTIKRSAVYQEFGQVNHDVRKLYLSDSGILWIGFGDGSVYRFDSGSRSFSFFARHTNDQIMCLFEFEGRLMVGYEKFGMDVTDLSGKLIRHYESDGSANFGLSGNRVRSITVDKSRNLWIGTYQGIDIMRNDTIIDRLNKSNTPEIPDNSIWALYADQEQNVWVGTWQGGVCFYHSFNSRFHYFNSVLYPLSDDLISGFAEDSNGNIWICTQRGGVMVYNPGNKTFRKVPVRAQGKELVNMQSVAVDKMETIWFGTFDGGVWYKPRGETDFRIFGPLSANNSQVLSILPADSGVWFGSFQTGLYYLDYLSGKVEHFSHDPYNINSLSHNAVRSILIDSRKNLWVATDKGLNVRMKGREEFRHFFTNHDAPYHLSSNLLYDLQEDKHGNIWMGTNGGGICRYSGETDRIDNFTIKDGLSGNDVYSILKDNSGNLWFSTENGLSEYLIEEGAFRSFINAKGISNNRFNPGAAFRSSNGHLYFGGSNGFVSFDPELIQENPIPPKTILTRFYLNNQLSLPGQPDYPFQTNISEATSVELKHNQNSFSFDFIATNFLQPGKNRFRFRLLGFNNEWAETDFTGRATYTNLSPGDYVFEVKAANNDGIWNEVPTRLSVKINPPFWKTWWAYLFYIFAIALLGYFLYVNVNSRRRLKQEIVFERIRRENEDHLHEMKLRFFTNISHELRTPLTLIVGPLERSLKKGQTLMKREMELMDANARRLLRLINQILEFRKIENDKQQLHAMVNDIIPVCRDIFSCFEELAGQKKISYSFSASQESMELKFDPEKLDMIIFNLLSNAFKFTPQGGSISVSVKSNDVSASLEDAKTFKIGQLESDRFIAIIIRDNGPGINESDLERIFERFFQSQKHAETGTGIGLALAAELTLLHKGEITVCASPGKGSQFILKLPTDHLDTDETGSMAFEVLPVRERNAENAMEVDSSLVHPDLYGSVIVVVEDNHDLLAYISELLKPYFAVISAADGDLGLETIGNFMPDLVISDVLMPGTDGIEVCKRVKGGISTSHIPVILLTALVSTEDQLRGLKVGADDYISKPFHEEILLAKVNNLLLSRKSLKESFLGDHSSWNKSISQFDLDRDLISKATWIVEENLQNQDFGVDMLASGLAISRSNLHRKLKSLTDQSGTEFIRYVKVQWAIKLMKEGRRPVNEIGFLSGFNSHTYFTKSFRQFTGYSPSDFLRVIKKSED